MPPVALITTPWSPQKIRKWMFYNLINKKASNTKTHIPSIIQHQELSKQTLAFLFNAVCFPHTKNNLFPPFIYHIFHYIAGVWGMSHCASWLLSPATKDIMRMEFAVRIFKQILNTFMTFLTSRKRKHCIRKTLNYRNLIRYIIIARVASQHSCCKRASCSFIYFSPAISIFEKEQRFKWLQISSTATLSKAILYFNKALLLKYVFNQLTSCRRWKLMQVLYTIFF